jgi:hypothetical protein
MVAKFVRGGAPSTAAALHGVLALGLVPMLLLKLGIAARWPSLHRFLPSLGMGVFCVSIVVGSTGLLMAAADRAEAASRDRAVGLEGPALVAAGRDLVSQACARCHGADRVYAHGGRKTRAEWTQTFERMSARDVRLEKWRRPILAFLHAELASDPLPPVPGDPGPAPSAPLPAGGADDHGRGRGRGGDDR